MKKLIILLFVFVLLVPVCSCSEDYTSSFGMTFNDFLLKYNAVSAPLDSPYNSIKNIKKWSEFDGYKMGTYLPCPDYGIMLNLITKDPAATKTSNPGLDRIQISMKNCDNFLAFFSVTVRCVSLFADDLFTIPIPSYYTGNVMVSYFENKAKKNDLYYYSQLGYESEYYVKLYFDGTSYLFEICTGADI